MTYNIQDEINYLQTDAPEEYNFYNLRLTPLALSYEANYPTFYKIAGYSIFRDLNAIKVDRQTYDFLNFLGDVGGLDGVLVIIGFYLTRDLQAWNLNNWVAR